MSNRSWLIATPLLLIMSLTANAADRLVQNQYLYKGQYAVSGNSGSYALTLQSDGTLLVRRSDFSTRAVLTTGAEYAVMQSDGNFVAYRDPVTPLWHTMTGGSPGNPGSYLVMHDDGDLVVYNSANRKLWNLGSDYIYGDPQKVGDVLGRDLAFTGAGYAGHLGIWDGGQVFEAGPPKSGTNNAINITNLFDFKHTRNGSGYAAYWGIASFKIPNGTMTMTACWDPVCPSTTRTVSAEARYSVALRVMQIYRIGADYTALGEHRRAISQWGSSPMQRGIYRCDTFVVDALYQSTFFPATGRTSDQQQWVNRFTTLSNGAKTPGIVYETLKTYQ